MSRMGWGIGKVGRQLDAVHTSKMSPVTTIDKDDPEFQRIAKECTPPGAIQTKHGLNQHYLSGEIDKSCKKRGW